MGTEANKQLVRRLVEEVVNERNAELLDELADKEFADLARRWISPFRGSFPDFRMEIVELVAEDDTVVAHLKCSGTHSREWLGVAPTGLVSRASTRSTSSTSVTERSRVRSASRTTSRACASI